MSNLVCVSGDFCSGSTLVFTLFRKTGLFHCLYEPLHERMREYMVYGMRAEEASHHDHVGHYHREFRGFRRVSELFDPRWGASGLYLPAGSRNDALYRYLTYLFGQSFGRAPRVMFKENRMTFRLGWFKAEFPGAKVVHIYRDKDAQWRSIVRRVQAHHGRQDVGQDSVHFTGFNVARWCEDLKPFFPELAADRSSTGFERFSKLWERSYQHNRLHSDISIDYEQLLQEFDATMHKLWSAIEAPPTDFSQLRQYVVAPRDRGAAPVLARTLGGAQALADRALRAYARLHVRLATARPGTGRPAPDLAP